MKTSPIARLVLLLSCLALSSVARAQTAPAAPAPAQPGYWNVETNRTTRDYTLVRFYNGQDQLVYEELLPNLCLDLARRSRLARRTTRQLDGLLHRLLREPALAQRAALLAQQFAPDRRVQRAYAAR